MINLKSRCLTPLGILRRVLLILGCLLFLASAISPFLFVTRPASIIPEDWDNTYFWSFKSSTQQIRSLRISQEWVEYWFYDYWVREYAFMSELSLVFPLMFVVQILTLIAGTASIFINRGTLAPAILCPMITASMIYVEKTFIHWHSYQQGYWLTYPSMLLFIVAFILSLATHKKQTAL